MRSAAVSSAARSAAASPASAARSSPGAISSAAPEAGCQRSNFAVYSSRAKSPRSRTASRIVATAASTAGSCAASKARSEAKARSKPGSSVERRLGCTRRLAKGLDERRDGLALELQGRGIDDEPARDGEDLLDRAQPVGPQRIAGVHE